MQQRQAKDAPYGCGVTRSSALGEMAAVRPMFDRYLLCVGTPASQRRDSR